MNVLVLALEALHQSYPDTPRHTKVSTRREPTKSAMAGMACQASGVAFSDDAFVERFAACEVSSRCDQEGEILPDNQNARGVMLANGKLSEHAVQAVHEYLENFKFKVAIGSDDEEFIHRLHDAFMLPAGLLWLGKKVCKPTRALWTPGCLVTTGETPRQVLERWPRANTSFNRRTPEQLRMTLDLGVGGVGGEIRHDHPISLDPKNRQFVDRRVATAWVMTAGLPIEPRLTNKPVKTAQTPAVGGV